MTWTHGVLALFCLTVPQVGVVRVTLSTSTLWGPGHIVGADEARHFKFGLQIELKEYWRYMC